MSGPAALVAAPSALAARAQAPSAGVFARRAAPAEEDSGRAASERPAAATAAAAANFEPGTEAAREAPAAASDVAAHALARARLGWAALVGRKAPQETPEAAIAAEAPAALPVRRGSLGRAARYAVPAAVVLAVPAAAHAAAPGAAGLAVPGLLAALALGFGLGMRHATDSDHVVAVATLVARTRRAGTAWLLGTFWGLGHTATIFTVGLGIIVFKLAIPVRLGLAMELSVGLVLAALGLANVLRARRGAVAEPLDGASGRGPLGRALAGAGKAQLLRSTFVGLVHGLAGSAAVALLVMAAMPTAAAALAYLAVFGAGTLAGMLLISACLESAMAFLARRGRSLGRWLAVGTGLLSLAFGLWVVWHIGFVDGLFLAHPHWVPK